jgi:hypothetical protein
LGCKDIQEKAGSGKSRRIESIQEFHQGETMNGRISAVLVAMGAMILFAGSASDRAGAQSSSRETELSAANVQDDRLDSRQDNGQQSGQPPQNSDYPRRDDTGRADDDRARRDDGRSDVPEEGERVTLPPDTIISVRIADEISSNKNHTGDIFTGIVDPSVLIHNQVVIPRGTEAHVRMAEDKKGGHIHGKAEVRLELVSLVVNGRRLGVESDPEVRGQGAMSAKVKAAEKSGEHVGGSATGVAGPAGSAAGPVIAAFSAPKVEMKANSRVEFILAEPFTFARPPVTNAPQGQ